jgi:hypothetical protein
MSELPNDSIYPLKRGLPFGFVPLYGTSLKVTFLAGIRQAHRIQPIYDS